MTILRADTLEPVPWRNGLGVTRDLLASPGGPAQWLVSVSDLDRDVPFSDFPGMNRTFTIIEGDGVELVLDDVPVTVPPLVPLRFRGESVTSLRLPFGPCRAFNVIADRSRFSATVAVLRVAPGASAEFDGTLVHCVAGEVEVGAETLGVGDTWIGGGSIRAVTTSTVVQVTLDVRSE